MEITIKIDMRTKPAKAFFRYLKALPFVEVKEQGVSKSKTESPYNPDFVKKIRRAEKQVKKGDYTVIDPNDVWGGLGL